MSDRAWADGLISGLEKENPAAVRLAQFACLAVRVDAPLLRHLRHRFLQDADPGTEADLWFSPLMSSQDASGCVLHDSVALRLRDRLAEENKALIQPAVEVLKKAHAHLPASLRLEEELTALALMEEPGVAGKIEQALQPALRSLSGADEASAMEVARWAMHARHRMHARVRSTESAQVLVLGAALRLETPGMATGMANADVDVETLSWVLPERARAERIRLGVSLFSNGIEFSAADGSEKSIELPKTNPALVSVRWRLAGTEHRQLKAVAPGVFVETGTGAESIEIVTLAGESYSLSASTTAEAVGSASGSSTAEGRSATLQNAPDDALPSCVLVEPLGSNAPPKIACAVGDGLWITAGPTRIPFLGTVGGSQADQFQVLNAHDERAQLAILRPLLPKSQQTIPKADPEPLDIGSDLTLLGFQGETPRRFSGRFDPYDGVTITDAELPAAITLLGAPVILDGRLLGILAAPKPKPPPNQRPMPSGDADLGDFVGETPEHWRFLRISAIEREIQALAGRQANVTGQATQRAAIDDHGASAACVRIGAWREGGPTAFAVDSAFLVTYGNENRWREHRGEDTPPEDLSREGDPAQYLESVEKDYEIVGGAETVRSGFLLLRPKGGAMPTRSLPLLSRDDPAIAGLYSEGVGVTVLAHEQGFRPASARAGWNDAEQRIEISIDTSSLNASLIDVLLTFDDWPDKIAGAPVLVEGKLLGMAMRREYVRKDEPVLTVVEAWKIREALDPSRTQSTARRRILLSHSAHDAPLASAIRATFDNRGLAVLQVGTVSGDLQAEFGAALAQSDLVIALVTPAALASDFTREEWRRAMAAGKPILPVAVDTFDPRALPLSLMSRNPFVLYQDARNVNELVLEAQRAIEAGADDESTVAEREQDPLLVREAQLALQQAGQKLSALDGVMGPQTRKALMDFQRNQDLKPSGRLTRETLAALESVRKAPRAANRTSTDPKWQEVATKLDLAKAYEELGDKVGARALLAEVTKGGDTQQKREAEQLLAKLRPSPRRVVDRPDRSTKRTKPKKKKRLKTK